MARRGGRNGADNLIRINEDRDADDGESKKDLAATVQLIKQQGRNSGPPEKYPVSLRPGQKRKIVDSLFSVQDLKTLPLPTDLPVIPARTEREKRYACVEYELNSRIHVSGYFLSQKDANKGESLFFGLAKVNCFLDHAWSLL